MGQIKKHKIKIFSEEHSSDFIVDLRENKKEIINPKLFFDEKIIKGNLDRFEDKNTPNNTYLNTINNNFIKKESKKIKDSKFFNKIFNKEKFKRTLFFPLWFFVFKIFKNIYYFFSDWFFDIYYFFKKISFFKGVLKIKKINLFKKKKPKNKFLLNFDHSNSKQLLLFKKRPKNKKKSFLMFFSLLLFIVLIFKGLNYYNLYKKSSLENDLMKFSLAALENFSSASEAVSVFDFYQAYNKFNDAGANFQSIDKELEKVDELVMFFSFFSDNKKIKAFSQSKNFSKVGIYLSSLGNNLSLSFNSLFLFFSGEDSNKNFNDFSYNIKRSLNDLKKVNVYLSRINVEAVPFDYQSDFEKIKKNFVVLEENLDNFVNYLPAVKDFLGVDRDKRYLLVFQNNSEIRASGGFVGSYALLDIKKGKIVNLEVPAGGSYDTEGGMKALVEAPKPLHLVKPTWYFWDANWWPDWLLSAKNLMWFLEKSGGPSVDGVISFTPKVLGDLLQIFGSIDLSDKYGLLIDHNNFQDSLQEVVEVIGNPDLYQDQDLKSSVLNKIEINKTIPSTNLSSSTVINSSSSDASLGDNNFNIFQQNKPKEIIAEVFDVLLKRVISDVSTDKLIKISSSLIDNLNKKNILLYFENNKLQEMAESYFWAGRLEKNNYDYLMVVDTNIAGAKSDRFLKKNYHLNSVVKEDGSIINKLRIERDRREENENIFSKPRNVNWLRIYVPLGSKLIKAEGFSYPDEKYFKVNDFDLEKNAFLEKSENKAEIDLKSGTRIYQESDKTVFANWTMTDIKQISVIEIEYELPANIFLQKSQKLSFDKFFSSQDEIFKHSLLWQKQAGSENSNFNFSLENETNSDFVWFSEQLQRQNNKLNRFGGLDTDKYFAFILK